MAARRDSAGRFIKGSVANPHGRAGRSDQAPGAARADGWGNLYSGVGTATYDRRTSTVFESDIVSDEQAIELMRGDDIAARLVEKLPRHALRPGFDCLIEGNKDLQEQIEKRWRDLGAKAALERAAVYERSRGGGAILIGAADALDLRKPLKPEAVREVTALNVFEPRECVPRWYYNDPLRPKFREPAIYQISPLCPGISEDGSARGATPFEVHESRLILFRGIQVSSEATARTHNQWGDSVLTRVWRVLRDFNGTWDSIALIMQDFAQSIFKIKDLAKLVKQDDFQTFKNRIRALEMGRSLVRASILDSEEEFERKSTSLAGVADVMDRFESRMAAAADMPVTVLFGRSPGGLNATGEGDLQNWHENISDYRDTQLIPALEQLTRCLLAEAGQPGANFQIEGRAIREESAREEAETRKIHAETAKILIENNVLFSEEVAESFFGGDSYNPEIVVDWTRRKQLEAEAEKIEQEQAERELATLKAEGVAAQRKPGAERLPTGKEPKE